MEASPTTALPVASEPCQSQTHIQNEKNNAKTSEKERPHVELSDVTTSSPMHGETSNAKTTDAKTKKIKRVQVIKSDVKTIKKRRLQTDEAWAPEPKIKWFDTWDAFDRFLEHYQRTTNQSFKLTNSTTVKSRNKQKHAEAKNAMVTELDESLRWYRKSFKCTAKECPVSIAANLKLQKEGGVRVVFGSCMLRHSHPLQSTEDNTKYQELVSFASRLFDQAAEVGINDLKHILIELESWFRDLLKLTIDQESVRRDKISQEQVPIKQPRPTLMESVNKIKRFQSKRRAVAEQVRISAAAKSLQALAFSQQQAPVKSPLW